MVLLKVLFLLLLAIPFFLFLIFIVNKLMDELPKRSSANREKMQTSEPGYKRERKEHKKSNLAKMQQRKARKQNRK